VDSDATSLCIEIGIRPERKDVVAARLLRQARELGLVRSEGRDYVVADGDVVLFRFNV
jgi:ribosome-binding ATPase YchF (GTP1/OBG family)